MDGSRGVQLLSSCLNMRAKLNQLLGKGNLTPGEYLVLRRIWQSTSGGNSNCRLQPVKPLYLSEALELSRPSITRLLNGLERKGFIKRKIDPDDRRSIAVVLTKKGIAELNKANERLEKLAEKVVEALGDDETDRLIDLVDKLAAIYQAILEELGGDSYA